MSRLSQALFREPHNVEGATLHGSCHTLANAKDRMCLRISVMPFLFLFQSRWIEMLISTNVKGTVTE